MPRAKIDLGAGWEAAFESKLAPLLSAKVSEEPRTERELSEISLEAAGGEAGLREMAGQLKKLYALQYGRHLSDRTARATIGRTIARVLSKVKSGPLVARFSVSKRKIQVGREGKHGRLFFSGKDAARSKLSKLYLSSRGGGKSLGREILLILEKRNSLLLSSIPYPEASVERAIAPLLDFGVVERRISKSGPFFCLPDRPVQDPSDSPAAGGRGTGGARAPGETIALAKKALPPSSLLLPGFSASRWILSPEGPREKRFRFSLAAFDKGARTLHLADFSEREASPAAARLLAEKASDLGLPAVLHLFAPAFSPACEKYAASRGVLLHPLGAKLKNE